MEMVTLTSFTFGKPFVPIDIDGCIAEYMKRRGPTERYASFDYCYNYFQSFRERGDTSSLSAKGHLAESCLHVAWHLASWGMLRNSHLLAKSLRAYEPLIDGIGNFDRRIWEIDVNLYDQQTTDCLLACKTMIQKKLSDGTRHPTDTLVTKVMLGVFGNVPAFDQNFCRAIGVKTMCGEGLFRIRDFCQKYRKDIDAHRIPSVDLVTGDETCRFYTKAKIIDMIGFVKGQTIRAPR
jgi:hypothetical protein